jgi:multiple sugar transport system ATP-binding protein
MVPTNVGFPQPMARVVLDQLTKTYPEKSGPGVTAVRGINLEIADREFMVLVGPSGCGKSTTLRMIAGLEEISAGTISIGGRVVNDLPPRDRDVAMVFQSYALYPHMSVYDNLAFGLTLRKLPQAEIDARVREAAALLQIEHLLERRPKALSGGQRQRVAVGRAIVRKPKVFLFDEPLSNLDAKMRVSTRAEISKLHARLGATMIYVTHDQVEAMTMGDRICVMNDGCIQQVAPPLELYQRPANRFVAGFIGSPAMNFFDGTLHRTGEAVTFTETAAQAAPRSWTLPPDVAAALRMRGDGPVVLGIRPEGVRLDEAAIGSGGGGDRAALVEVVERMGAETLVHLTTGTTGLVARAAPGIGVRPGDRVRIEIDFGAAHFFDPATGGAIR